MTNRERIIRYLALPLDVKLHITNALKLNEIGDYRALCGIHLDKVHLKRAADRKIIDKVWEMMAAAERRNEIDRLDRLEEEFEAHGGRGVELVNEINLLRASLYPDEEGSPCCNSMSAEGLSIQVSRNEVTDIIVVDISTTDLADKDTHLDTAVPDIRIMVNNDGPIRLRPDGSLCASTNTQEE